MNQHGNDAMRGQGGPLAGLRVVEFAGLGPGPFACMLLSDMGADVITIHRPGARLGDPGDITGRGRSVVIADLKQAGDHAPVLALLGKADMLVEGFRPGVMERLGMGPEALAAINPGLIYGRITGWGQSGPLAQAAGHDINYIALSGALHAIGAAGGAPVPPLNLVGDYAGGSLYLVCGLLAALHERHGSGRGQTVDAAITDGTFSLMSTFLSHCLRGQAQERRGSHLFDGGAPFYGVYETADARHVTVGALEPQFFALLCERVGIDAALRGKQYDRQAWPLLHQCFAARFRAGTQAEWSLLLEGTDCCYAPVLPLSEAMDHPHHAARQAFVDIGGVRHPAPAPRLSRSAARIQGPAPGAAIGFAEALQRWL